MNPAITPFLIGFRVSVITEARPELIDQQHADFMHSLRTRHRNRTLRYRDLTDADKELINTIYKGLK